MQSEKQTAKSAKRTNSRHKKDAPGTQSSLHSFFTARKPTRTATNSNNHMESNKPTHFDPRLGRGEEMEGMVVVIDLDSDLGEGGS